MTSAGASPSPATPRAGARWGGVHVHAPTLRLLLAGVFFTFAPFGFLVQLAQRQAGTVAAGLTAATISGCIAIGWAYAFITRRYWLLLPVVAAQLIGPPLVFTALGAAGFAGESSIPEGARRALFAAGAVACIVAGYVLVIVFTRAQEREATAFRTELDVARRIHARIAPPIDLATPACDVLGRSMPSSAMGGDLIDAHARDGEVDVFLADVSGHGVGAGIVMGMVKSAIRMRLRSGAPLQALVTDLNAVLADLTEPHMFATFACLRIRDAEIEYALAGHLPILRVARDGTVTDLANEHLPLGVTTDERFATGRMPAVPGDVLVLLTDGLTEVMNSAGRQLGLEPLRRAAAANAGLPLPALHDALVAAVRAHGPQADDQSLLLVRVHGPSPPSAHPPAS